MVQPTGGVAVAFCAPIYALEELKAKIEALGHRVAGEEHEKDPDRIPNRAERAALWNSIAFIGSYSGTTGKRCGAGSAGDWGVMR